MRKLGMKIFFLATGVLGIFSNSAAQFDRGLDPVIVLGSECGEFLSLASADLRVYAFNAETATWAPIPFQFDDFVIDNSTEGGKKVEWSGGNGIIDGVDEIVFMARDMGDQTTGLAVWPDDNESRMNARYEVIASDPTSGEDRYAYLFYSSTLALNDSSYISYANDIVLGTSYTIGHDTDDAGGLPDSLTIAGNNIDVLDGWRVRAHIDKIVLVVEDLGGLELTGRDVYFSENMDDTFRLVAGFLSLDVNARAFHEVDSLKVKAGPIRVIRRHILAIRFETTGLVDTSRIPITTIYYDKSVEFKPSFSLDLGDDVKELESDFIAFSSGFEQNSMNVKFYGNGMTLPGSATVDTLIDQQPPNVIFKKDLGENDWPGKHWFGFTGQDQSFINNASFVTIADLQEPRIAPGRAPALYYYDYKDDERDPDGVYGIAGLRIYDWSSSYSKVFDLHAVFRKFYLDKNSTQADMQALFDQYSVPMMLSFEKQGFPDTVPPAKIADLSIASRTDTSATLSWTAVGDDSMSNGPAQFYVIRYSTVAPTNPDGNDWAWWGAQTTTTVNNPPPPANPGTTQTFKVTGLQEATTYYFRINVVDDVGQASGLSNTASGSTTPVELVSFNALVLEQRNVLLKWETASETNNLGFAVERKFGETGEWRELGFVKGAGTTAKGRNYSYQDTPESVGEWCYRLRQVDANGAFEYSDAVTVSIASPQQFALSQNYPNPFNPTTRISFQIPTTAEGQARLVIYDMLGRQVRTLLNRELTAGYYDLSWDGNTDNGLPAASGIYLYRLRAGEFSAMRKMVKMQ